MRKIHRQDSPDLPEPDAQALAHSNRLREQIHAAIRAAGGRIPFSRYMELALYAPGLGYYSAGAARFGPQGDFVTAPGISPLFARCIARQCADVFESSGAEILEYGAGTGIMAAEILLELERLDTLPARYHILELGAALRAQQQDTLGRLAPHLAARVRWLDSLPEPGFSGVVLANEVLDAMPVHRCCIGVADAEELYVGWEDGLAWCSGPLSDPALAGILERVQAGGALPAGYTSEISLAAAAWVRSLAQRLGRALVLIIDYGYPQHEYYHPQRSSGTLQCHYRHRRHADPFFLPGLQDITAHVEFTALAQAARDAGLDVAGFTTQAHFLFNSGLMDLVSKSDPESPAEHLDVINQVRRLTLPGEMGELFKVLALTHGIDAPLTGFRRMDQRHRL